MNKSVPKNIFILKYRALGDAIISTAAVSYLRHLYPKSKIIYGVPAWTAPLFKNTQTDADQIYPLKLNGPLDWMQLWKFLKSQNIDTVIELFQSGRTSKFFHIWKSITGNNYTFHNHHLKSGGPVHDQGVIKPVIQRDLDGIWSFHGQSQPLPSYKDWKPSLKIMSTKENSKFTKVVFGIVATRETKMWNIENYVTLARILKDENQNLEILVPLSRSSTDERLKLKLLELKAPVKILQVPLDQLPLELSGSDYYVGNDTGLKHLCVSLGVKTFTLFGPEPPNEWHPYDKNEHPYFYKEPLECRTVNGHYCGLSQCDSMICLEEFSPQLVFEKLCAHP